MKNPPKRTPVPEQKPPPPAAPRNWGVEFGIIFLLLLGMLALIFHGAFAPHHTVFSNDGPLGRLISRFHQFPDRFTGSWADLNGFGFSGGAAPPGISIGLQFLLKPVLFSKLYPIIALLILGLGAWCLFYQLKLSPMACRVGALGAAFNSCFFSVACWGVAAQTIAAGMTLFAMAALTDTTSRLRWWRVALGGFAVGLGVVDGADVGAIFSFYVAAFLVFQAWIATGPANRRLMIGLGRLVLVVLCAGFIAAQAISSLVGTSIEGIAGTAQDVQTKESRWDWATQWSLPVPEAAGLAVPGLFGYRMDTHHGGAYWGQVGQDPTVTRYLENGHQGPTPHGFMRYSGGGFYAGVLVVLLTLWAFAQSLRGKDSVFTPAQRQWLWFWMVLAVLSLLLAFGRFAPFYQVVYALPYFSTIRNPIKFIYPVSIAIMVMFAYGLDGLSRRYLSVNGTPWAGVKAGWAKAASFDRKWLIGCGVVLALSLLGWIQYASSWQELVDYFRTVQLDHIAESVASFSIRQVGWFVLFFILSSALLAAVFFGAFTGPKARWAGLALGLLVLVDLGRANLPWIVIWDYQAKYASNSVIDYLRDKPYEHRVTIFPGMNQEVVPNLSRLYRLEWLQQQFPFYDIQTLDIVDLPRKPVDYAAYMMGPTLYPGVPAGQSYLRMWQLTNTRYIFGTADEMPDWNQYIAAPDRQLRILERFDLIPKPGITNVEELDQWTAVPSPTGNFALFDYAGALPRAKLYAQWQSTSDDHAALSQIFKPDFDPLQTVVVSGDLPPGAARSATQASAGTVNITSYAPRDIVLKSEAATPTVLLLNDHYDPSWKVWVDQAPAPLLRCNYIMRGVYLPAGTHSVEFRYLPPVKFLSVSLAAIGLALAVLLVVLIASGISPRKKVPADNGTPVPRS